MMGNGDGGDAGGDLWGDIEALHGRDLWYDVGPDGRTPVPNIKRVSINGAPVIEASHENVIGRSAEPKNF